MRTSVKYFLGAAFGSGEQWQSWIHLTDLGRIFLFAGKKRINGIVNGVAPNPVTNTKLVREIAKAIDKPLWLPNIPKFMLQILLGQMSYILLVSQRVCSTKLETLGFKFKFKNVNNALAQLEKLEEENAL
jgi:NAD dependent epimerase/dehydratase family enzyme